MTIVNLMRFNVLGLTLVLLGAMCASGAYAKERIKMYSYHNKPPYFLASTSSAYKKPDTVGIYRAFVAYLNSQLQDVEVVLEFSPRIRLERSLTDGKLDGAIIGVNPLWFKDKKRTKYLWSHSFMKDKDVIVVRTGKAFPYEHPKDLEGKSLALPRGLYFWGVTERIKKGVIQVFETNSDVQNLGMVEIGRADGTIISTLSAKHLFKQRASQGLLEVLKTPHDQFERMILFPANQKRQFSIINKHIEKALNDDVWLKELAKHHYEP
jgi:polar amino acid transport system substrate-binding protein